MILLVSVEPELRTRLRAEENREQAPALQMELSTEVSIAEDSGESRKTLPTSQTSTEGKSRAKARPYTKKEKQRMGWDQRWRNSSRRRRERRRVLWRRTPCSSRRLSRMTRKPSSWRTGRSMATGSAPWAR